MDYETIPSGWNSSRKCGYTFYSGYDGRFGGDDRWESYVADPYVAGRHTSYKYISEQRCNCPTKYGPYEEVNTILTDIYTAICQHDSWISSDGYWFTYNIPDSANWVRSNTCPKGWGKYYDAPESKTEPYVKNAQGYVPMGYKEPIYGYVTRYRDVYYDYLSTRIAKS